MKILLLFFSLLCAHTFHLTAGFYSNHGSGLKLLEVPLKTAIENKCRTTGNPKQIEYALEELDHCVSDLLRGSPGPLLDLTDYNQDHCSYFNKSELGICLKNLTINISPCLAENEIYIQQSLLKAFDVVYEEFCGANGVSNQHYVYEKVNRTGECMQMCGLLLFMEGSCNTTNLNIFKQLDKGILSLNKHDVCSDLKSLSKCTTQLAEALCNEEYSRLADLIFHPFLLGCYDLEARKR